MKGRKSVSSTVGHGLMKTNPYAERRFQEAKGKFYSHERHPEKKEIWKALSNW